MARSLLLLTGLAAFVLVAGCLDGLDRDLSGVGDAPGVLVPTTTPLWYNPQTFPHPMFNYPTLTNPPTDWSSTPWLKPIPARDLPSPIVGFEHIAQVEGSPRGTGMMVIGSLAILPSNPTTFVDISDPENPVKVGEFPVSARGSDVIVYPDGRIAAVLATGGSDIVVLDITDPTNAFEMARLQTAGTHKVDVVPGTPIVYNSARTEIFDLTDPSNPIEVEDRMPRGCHRTYFHIDPAEAFYRAYCAGYEVTEIWDIADPRKPVVVSTINMWHADPNLPPSSAAPATFSHFSIPSHDAKILVVGDEMGGGAAPACAAHAGTPMGDVSVPTGALWFYDISDEQNVELRGWLSPTSHFVTNQGSTSCTAHHGRLVPDPDGRHLLAMGFYGAGVLLVDFTDPSSPRLLDQWNDGANVWEAMYYNGYVFTGDMARGLDAIAFR